MFCGIGPMAIRAAKESKLRVLANDLNPECYHYLRKNIVLNKIADYVIPFCMDAREFALLVIEQSNNPDIQEFQEESKSKRPASKKTEEAKLGPESERVSKIPSKQYLHFDHVYMNLPMDAVEFLDVFIGLFKHGNPAIWNEGNLPMIHVYGFTVESDKAKAREYFVERINKVFEECGGFNESMLTEFHNNRDVSKVSHMYCISFRLPAQVGFHSSMKYKRQKL